MPTYSAAIRESHLEDDAAVIAFLSENGDFLRQTVAAMLDNSLNGEPFSRWVKLQDPLKAVLQAHGLFGVPVQARLGTKGVLHAPGSIAPRLLEVTGERGPDEAVAWMRRIFSCENTEIVAISVVSGLRIAGDISFDNDVTIGPASSISFSRQAQSLANPMRRFSFDGLPRWGEADCFAWKIVSAPIVKGKEGAFLEGVFPDEDARADTQELLLALALDPEAAPTSSAWWSEAVDPDFVILARGGGGSMGQKDDGPEQHISTQLSVETPGLINRYLKTQGKFRNKLRTALSGLHLSRRVRSPNSRAIELCISLEALLGGGENNEIIHKVSTRGSIVLSERDFVSRKEIRKSLKALYGLRSRAVHGTYDPKHNDYDVVNLGGKLASETVRVAVNYGEELPLEEIDLMGEFSLKAI